MLRIHIICLYVYIATGVLAATGQNVHFTKFQHLAQYDNLGTSDQNVSQSDKSFIASSIVSCANSCEQKQQCEAFIFKTTKKECQLLNKYTYDVKKFLKEDGTKFYIKVDSDGKSHVDVTAAPMLSTTNTDSSECFADWIAYKGSCYLFVYDEPQFLDAKQFCENHQSYLVNIRSAEENKFLKAHLRGLNKFAKTWWMGLTDYEQEGVWKWVDTNTVTEFTDWAPSQPNPSEEDCVAFWLDSDFKWGDVPCTWNCSSVC